MELRKSALRSSAVRFSALSALTGNAIEKGAEWADVTIRCYLLDEGIEKAMEELEEEIEKAIEEEPEDESAEA